VNPGQTFTCQITMTNPSATVAANGIRVDDQATAGARVVGVGTTAAASQVPGAAPANCQVPAAGSNGNFHCDPLSFAPSTTQTLFATFEAQAGSACKSTLTNTASITDAENDPPDASTATITVECNEPAGNTPACTIDYRTATTGVSIRGTEGPDVICGSPFGDSIQGMGGDDIIFGNGGNDSISGGNGDDLIFGGDGNDSLQGSFGNDRLFGNDGNDSISGSPGTDTANGGAGTDSCSATTTSDCEPGQTVPSSSAST
jgi:hypothetical protein